MIAIDFDLARYVALRRGQVEQRARDGAAYAYSGERKVLRALISTRPVRLAIEATNRLWKSSAKRELLESSIKASDREYTNVYQAMHRASRALGLMPPPTYIASSALPIKTATLGAEDEAYVVLGEELVATLSESELSAVLGHELGHVQNNHIAYTTALHYLQHEAVFFVRWIVRPAIMALQAWSRRGEITCDRAALLCARDMEATSAALVKMSTGLEGEQISAYLADLPDSSRGVRGISDLFRSHPYLPKRIEALRVFADSAFYKRLIGEEADGGMTTEEVEHRVGEIVSVF